MPVNIAHQNQTLNPTIAHSKVCILDYGSGNVKSVFNMIQSFHPQVKLSNNEADFVEATHIILPGVGAFGAAMERINALHLRDLLEEHVLRQGKWFLGICVGMQILAETGFEHGRHKGLGWIKGEVKLIDAKGERLPHIGWNNIKILRSHPLLKNLDETTDFYFVNSYQFETADINDDLALTEYGQDFVSIVGNKNIFGVQFHPEKSQKAGKQLLTNFLSLK